jgi:SAM-dependent methyltransferase
MVPPADSAQDLEAAAGDTTQHPLLPFARPLIVLLQGINRWLRFLSLWTHRVQGAIEGRFDRRRMWFDHYVDLNWKLPTQGDAMFLERAVFSRILLDPDARLLEIACGDGYFTRYFYAPRVRSVVAIDIDPSAIAFARKANGWPNITYEIHDLRAGLPPGDFSHVIWDGAMLYFTVETLDQVFGWIHERLGPSGLFSGYTYADYIEERPYIRHRVDSPQDVANMLGKHFENVVVLRTEHPERSNFYFAASDAELPPATAGLFYQRRSGDQTWATNVHTRPFPTTS